jgi:HemY protein
MVRVLLYVLAIFLIALGFAWLADRPGAIVLTWQGYEIRASLMVAAAALAILIAAIALVGAVIRGVLHTPRAVGHFLGSRRRDRGYRALSRGMIAVGAGDIRAARRNADEARSLLAREPLTLLLSAQAAQLAGDAGAARTSFEALAAQPETRLLGLHGLFIEAKRQGEREAARHFAEEAVKAAPAIGWAGTALFEYQSQAGEWQAALQTLSGNEHAKLVDKATARRYRATLLTARAMELESGDPDEARALALEAHRLAPVLVPATVVAGRLLARAGDIKRASKVLEAGWKAFPHPDIAEAYASVRPGDAQRDRLKRVRHLADLRANHLEGSIAVARAAVDAHDWAAAREALDGLVKAGPSERVCMLMAEIEEGEHGDQGRVRQWLTRAFHAPRDPAWVADGHIYERWAPVSPVSGRVGVFEWKVAAEQLPPPPAPEIEAEPAEAEKPIEMIPPPPAMPPVGEAKRETEPPPISIAPRPEPPKPPAAVAAAPALGRAPDDPGPDHAAEEDGADRRLY